MSADIYTLYTQKPPVITDRNGNMIRHYGASHRRAFWDGVDGIRGGYPEGSWGDLAWKAGRESRNKGLPSRTKS